MEIFNTAGQLLATAYGLDTNELQMPLNYLGTGIYFCRIETEQGIFVHKIVKE